MGTQCSTSASSLTSSRWAKFCRNITNENEKITIVSSSFDTVITFNELKDLFFKNENLFVTMLNLDDVCAFLYQDEELYVTTNNIAWWCRQKNGVFDRIEQLYAKVDITDNFHLKTTKAAKPASTSKSTIKIACAIFDGKELTNIETFNGQRSEGINVINKYCGNAVIRHHDESDVRVLLNYNDDEFDVLSNWQTLEKHEQKGVIVLI